MTYVLCRNTDCKHCNVSDHTCQKQAITIGDDFDSGCSELDPYYNDEEYNEKYYKCVRTKSGELAKAESYGKRIEYKGRVFYTFDRITEDGDYKLTDAETGYGVGIFEEIGQRFDKICEMTKRIPDVKSLPLAEWDGGDYVLVKEVTPCPTHPT